MLRFNLTLNKAKLEKFALLFIIFRFIFLFLVLLLITSHPIFVLQLALNMLEKKK